MPLPRVILALVLVLAGTALSHAQALKAYHSRHYIVHTNLPRKQAELFGRHIDLVHEAYDALFRRAGMPRRDQTAFPLYLLQTQEQYQAFLAQHQIDGSNSGGMFFLRPTGQGLVTFTAGRSIAETLAVLQHEGFHQFAFAHIGTNLPIWVNEGLAQYYEEGILLGKQLHLGLAPSRRLATVRIAIQNKSDIDFNSLLAMSNDDWHQALVGNAMRAGLLYDQSWSIVFFLIHGDNGRYREAFESYLKLLGAGRDSTEAFTSVFGQKTEPFRDAWRRWALAVEPDPLPLALERMEFLSRGLLYLQENNLPLPRSTAELRSRLQKIQFRATRLLPGGATLQFNAGDEDVYRYRLNSQSNPMFDMLEPAAQNLPPRLTAPGLKPTPTLVWYRDEEGKLQSEITYR